MKTSSLYKFLTTVAVVLVCQFYLGSSGSAAGRSASGKITYPPGTRPASASPAAAAPERAPAAESPAPAAPKAAAAPTSPAGESTTGERQMLYQPRPLPNGKDPCQVLMYLCTDKKGELISSANCSQNELAKCAEQSSAGAECKDLSKDLSRAIKDMNKSAKDKRKDDRDEKKDIAKLQEELTQVGLDRDEKLNSIKDKAEETQTDAKEAVDKIKEKLEDNQKKVADAIIRLETQLDEGESKKRDLKTSKVQAQNAYLDAVARLDAQCHSMALARVKELRDQMMKSMDQSTYSAGGFNALMSSAGYNNKKRSQILAEKYFTDCRDDRAYKEAINSAGRARDTALKMADGQSSDIEKVQEKIRQQIVQLQTKEQDTLLKRALSDMQHVQDKMTSNLAKLDREAQKEMTSAASKMRDKQNEIWRRQQELTAKRDDAQFTSQIPGLQSALGGGASKGPKGALDTSADEYEEIDTLARMAMATCCLEGMTEKGVARSTCMTACKYVPEDDRAGCDNYTGPDLSGKAPKSDGVD